jgi:DNA invertase Pin-like site-specific DNA recombinase
LTTAAVYARTSTTDQAPANQLIACTDYCARRGWNVQLEYVDQVSGIAKDRPAFERLIRDARRGRFDVLVVWRLDRLGRSTRAVIELLDELTTIGVDFASVDDSIDLSTPAGKCMATMISAFAELERTMIADRVRAGIERRRREGKTIGRPARTDAREQLAAVDGLAVRAAAKQLGVSPSTIVQWRKALRNADPSTTVDAGDVR